MLTLVAAVLLAANPGSPAPVKLASPGFTAVGVKADVASFFADHFAQQLVMQDLRVITASEISAVIGFERQKQLLGCTDDSASCMSELANALGADGLIVGSIARFEGTYQINLKIVGSADASLLAAYSTEAEGDKAVLRKLNEAAQQMAPAVKRKLGRAVDVPVAAGPPPVPAAAAPSAQAAADAHAGRRWPIVPTVLGGVLVVGGTGLLAKALDEVSLTKRENDLGGVRSRIQDATTMRYIGTPAVLLGAGALGYAAWSFFSTPAAPAQASAWAAPGGGGVVVTGTLP